MSEAELQQIVIDAAHLFGWRVRHVAPARTNKGWRTPERADGKGFPDLTLAHRSICSVIFAELKTERGVVSNEQKEWLAILPNATVWRPSDWDNGTIERVLRSGRL